MAESESKKITVDFTGSGDVTPRRTTARRAPRDDSEMRVRSRPLRDMNKTAKRNSLLKFIRRHQENNYRKLMNDEYRSPSAQDTKTDLDETLGYLMNLTDQLADSEPTSTASGHGHGIVPSYGLGADPTPYASSSSYTMKQYPTEEAIEQRRRQVRFPENENVSLHFPSHPTSDEPAMVLNPLQAAAPRYGCLKQGQLPTYRSLIQQTPSASSSASPMYDEIALKYVRQKRTNRRTHKLGKSNVYPKIGVLVSNKTMRKDITTQSHHLKQASMNEIRQYLVKHGLIKVGTAAPNHVLRKMYECSKMLCGEVYNHNTDIMLHNFVHGSGSEKS